MVMDDDGNDDDDDDGDDDDDNAGVPSEECDGDEHNECFDFPCPDSHPVNMPELHWYYRYGLM